MVSCELFWENATAANGKKYAVQVYFSQTDKAALHASEVATVAGTVGFPANATTAACGS